MIGSAEASRATFRSLLKFAKTVQLNGRPALEDPVIRQRFAEIDGYVSAHLYSGYRQLTLAARNQEPGLASMLNKLTSTNIGHKLAKLALDLAGDQALESPSSDEVMNMRPRGGQAWISQYMWSLGVAIAGGTANIQRNVIAERGLGLPRDRAVQRS